MSGRPMATARRKKRSSNVIRVDVQRTLGKIIYEYGDLITTVVTDVSSVYERRMRQLRICAQLGGMCQFLICRRISALYKSAPHQYLPADDFLVSLAHLPFHGCRLLPALARCFAWSCRNCLPSHLQVSAAQTGCGSACSTRSHV